MPGAAGQGDGQAAYQDGQVYNAMPMPMPMPMPMTMPTPTPTPMPLPWL